jgi:D-glycero-D-manno-heptose 1,7-bisphosphate phosphatase
VTNAGAKPRIEWVFLDRDGTINHKAPDGGYVKNPAELTLIPGAARAIRRLNDAGIWVGIVTNQRGIALGMMTEADFAAIQSRLQRDLSPVGAHIDAVYHCPHADGTCDCRKPAPGMLLRARSTVPGMEFQRAALIGDSASDIAAGRRVGALTVWLSADEQPGRGSKADHVAPSLERAVDWLIQKDRRAFEGSASL